MTIFKNGHKGNGAVIALIKEELWNAFLERCSKSLNINALRVFNHKGVEIDSSKSVIPNEILYISSGESFLPPTVLTHANDWVTVNVGGKRFSTTRSTLGKDPNSMLAKMFGSDWESQKDESGAYLIDRTPEYFAPILNFLRCGQIIIDPGVNVEGVLEEARFFNIQEMLDPLEVLVNRKLRKANSLTRKELVSILLTSSTNVSLRCQGLDLSEADLSKLDLSNINFKMTNFRDANLERSNLDNALLQEANLAGANLQFASLRGANLGSANLEGANLRGANFEDRGGMKANLEGAKLKGAHLEDCNFSGANLRASNLRGCNLENANLRRADLAGADLEGVNLRGANLNKANLIGANLHNVNFDIRTTTPWG